ncbi:hypothetical protein CLHUN_26840 [Ruminiclostridium hungatei]|uniref:Uncharacterized protein n=1 Tax=Ruminiclostridium hungatei TaxID=48256 RepID=A0A1V4SHH5_RUMHU|nr:hypothetical protein [Ruminiclostridium hungatei]OPX43339.1 hypothetical protein CLHUN_26840 [Ruminiclostridium hungatei]
MLSKLSNFWYYHKNHVLAAIILLVIAVFVIIVVPGGTPSPDIQVGYVTDGREVGEAVIEEMNSYFENVIKDVDGDNKRYMDFIPLIGPRVDVEFSSDGVQLILIDGNTLDLYKNQGVFEPLDAVVKKHGLDVSMDERVLSMTEGQKETHIFALPVSKIKYLLDRGFPGDNYYLAVRMEYENTPEARTKNKNSYSVLEKMLEYRG